MVLASVTGLPSHFPFTLIVDPGAADAEVVTVTQAATGSGPYTFANCIRGDDGTSAAMHAAGTPVQHGVAARDFYKGGSDWVNVLSASLSGGADPTGANDSTAAIQAAIAALPASGGVVYFPAGTYSVSGTLASSVVPTYLTGDGQWATVISYSGTGDCIRLTDTSGNYLPGGGGITGLTIDGTSAGTKSSGFHISDIYNFRFDVGVQNFTASGCIGAWLDNQHAFGEQPHGRIWVHKCSTGVQFDNSTGTTVSLNATGSFDRAQLDIMLDQKGAGNSVVFANGAFMINGRLGIYGNTDYSTVGGPFYVLTLSGTNSAGSSLIRNSVLNVGVECNATSGTQPATINFATIGHNVITGCTGIMDFSGNNPFAHSANPQGSIQFDGPIFGDTTLWRSANTGAARFSNGAIGNGGEIVTKWVAVSTATPASTVTGIIMQTPQLVQSGVTQTVTVINQGSGSITFAASGTSNVADGTSDTIAVNGAATYVWSTDESLWYRCT